MTLGNDNACFKKSYNEYKNMLVKWMSKFLYLLINKENSSLNYFWRNMNMRYLSDLSCHLPNWEKYKNSN